MPLASRIAPRATRLGVRGRSTEEQIARWFRRHSPTSFDEADIRFEAEAFAAFLEMTIDGYGLDAEKVVLMGYSNGANFAAAAMMLHAGAIRRAMLFRPSLVLAAPPEADLRGIRAVLIPGEQDSLAKQLPSPEGALRERDAAVEVVSVSADHSLSAVDVDAGKKGLAFLLK